MAFVLLLVFLGLLAAELAVFIAVAHAVGFLAAFVLLVLVSLVGIPLCKWQGMGAWRRFQETVARGEVPGPAMVDGVLILAGGVLMLLPGFVTGALGLLLLVPFTRHGVRALVVHRIRRKFDVHVVTASSGVVDVEGWEVPPSGPPALRGPSGGRHT